MASQRLADGLAGLGVPLPRRLVPRRGDDALAVGAERRAIHKIRMAFERLADGLAGLGVPQPRRLVKDAVTMRLPSGLNAALYTSSSWPLSGSPMGLPVSASHSRAVLSPDAVTMRLPSGLNAALRQIPTLMAFERLADWLAGLGVPQPRRLVPRRGDDALAVGAERRADTQHPHGL